MRAHEPWADMAALLLRTSASSGWRWGGWEPLLSASWPYLPGTTPPLILPLFSLWAPQLCFPGLAAFLAQQLH